MRSSTSRGSTDLAYPDSPNLKLLNRLVRTRTPGGVAGEPPMLEAPLPIVQSPPGNSRLGKTMLRVVRTTRPSLKWTLKRIA